jgi:hypothetical protein
VGNDDLPTRKAAHKETLVNLSALRDVQPLNPIWEAGKTPLDDFTSATVSADPLNLAYLSHPPHKRLYDQILV